MGRLFGVMALWLFALGAIEPASAQTGNPGGGINDNLGAFDYGVCRGVDRKCFHNWERAKTDQLRVLLFTRTAGPRHQNLGPALAAGLNPQLTEANVVQKGMLRLAEANGWKLDYTEDLQFMTRLDGYNAVVFFSTSRDALDDDGKTALRQYMRAGGGFVAVHNAFGTMYNWPYYEGLLGGANYYDHGPNRTGEVVVLDKKDSSTRDLPTRWSFKDEWYNLVPFPTRVRFLATIDEASWSPVPEASGAPPPGVAPRGPPGPAAPRAVGKHPGHGSFHPVAWCQYYDGGKVWATTLGHDAGIFSADGAAFPGALAFQKMLVGAVRSVAGATDFCQ